MDIRELSNYIYYKNSSWLANKASLKSNLAIGSGDISQAYIENANKLEANLNIGILPDDFVEQIQKLLDFKNQNIPALNQEISNFFQEIQNFVGQDLTKRILTGGITVGNANIKLKQATLDLKNLHEICANFQKIIEKINEFDNGFKELGMAEVSFLSNSAMSKTKKAYDEVQNFIAKYSSSDNLLGIEQNKKEIIRLIGLITGDLKGGLYEFADYIHSLAISTAIEEVEKQVKIAGGRLAGTDSTYIPSEELQNALGQDLFVNKADNIVTALTYDKNGVSVEINIGISDKSYKSGTARGKSLASGISWQALMYEANLTESAFEYYYANMMVHEKEALTNQRSDLNSYLAAKASAFIISGISGGTSPQAFFIRYSDKIVYVPNLLRNLAGKKSIFQIRPTSKSIDNTFIQTDAEEMTDAYIRTKNTMAALRSGVTFNAYK